MIPKNSTCKTVLTWNELIVSWMKSLICLESPSTCSSVMKVNTNSWIPNNGISTSVDLANLKKKMFDYSIFFNILGARIKNSVTEKFQILQRYSRNISSIFWLWNGISNSVILRTNSQIQILEHTIRQVCAGGNLGFGFKVKSQGEEMEQEGHCHQPCATR